MKKATKINKNSSLKGPFLLFFLKKGSFRELDDPDQSLAIMAEQTKDLSSSKM